MHRRLDSAHKAGSHVDTTSTQAQRGSKSVTVCETTAGDERNTECLARFAKKDEIRDIALSHVAGALESIDAQEVDTQLNSALRMTNRGALVQNNNSSFLELRDDRTR